MSEFLFFIVIFLANIIQGITGFAGTILAMPFSIHLVGYDVAKPVLNMLGILASIYMVSKGFQNINWREMRRVVAFMTVGIAIGLILKHYIGGYEKILYTILGCFVIFIGARGLYSHIRHAVFLKKNNPEKLEENRAMARQKKSRAEHLVEKEEREYVEKGITPGAMATLVLAGVVHGIFVSGGPLIVSYLTSHSKSKEEFVRTVSAVWVILNSIVFVSDLIGGYYTLETMRVQLIAVPFLFGGMFLGGFLYKHMSQMFFTILTYILLCIAGLSLLVK